MEAKMKKYRRKRNALIVLNVFLALVLIALVLLLLSWKGMLDKMDKIPEVEGTLSSQEESAILEEGNQETVPSDFTGPSYAPDETVAPTEPVTPLPNNEDVLHILLVGQDRRSGQSRQRSDAMILCTINKKEKTLVFTSFLRDTWVSIPGYYNERLNVPYAIGGFSLLNDTLEHNFGVRADYNAEVDFTGFEKIINVIGGVDIELTGAEARHLNKRSGWSLQEGMNHLDGKQALEYARIRALDSDFGRTNRQRIVLYAMVEKAKTLSLTQLLELADEVLPMLKTDMSAQEITGLLVAVAPILSELTIIDQSIPYGNAYQFASIDGKSVIVLNAQNLEKNLDRLKETIGGE